jgi:Mn-dependent DtxR family transcriptional regulator
MLGVRRTSVSLVAGALQKAGLIHYRRGKIEILDTEAVERSACECYAKVRSQYDHLLKTNGSRA